MAGGLWDSVVAAGLLFCMFAPLTQAAKCQDPCNVNTDCTQGNCTTCILDPFSRTKKCGNGCSQPCTRNAECGDVNCKFCYAGICTNSPEKLCGATCKFNHDCSQDPKNSCQQCIGGHCTAGCGHSCTNNNDCGGNKGCNFCIRGQCSFNNATCGDHCKLNSDCDQNSNCRTCRLPNLHHGTCTDICYSKCDSHKDCEHGTCPFCGKQGWCIYTPNAKCGEPCRWTGDCDQSGGYSCQKCINGKCGATCGHVCKKDSECIEAGCGHCLMGSCAKDSAKCGAPCDISPNCDHTTECNLCHLPPMGKGKGQCSAGCGAPCKADSQCLNDRCQFCKMVNGNGTCEPEKGGSKCHQDCVLNSDCSGSPGTCENCVSGKCGSPCGAVCKANSDCITPGCGRCSGGLCAVGE